MGYEGDGWESIEQEFQELEQEFFEQPQHHEEHHHEEHHHEEHHHHHHHVDEDEWSDDSSQDKPPTADGAPPPPVATADAPLDLQTTPNLSEFSGILGDLNLGDLTFGAPSDSSAPPAPADPSAPPPPAPSAADSDAQPAAGGARIEIQGDIRVTPAGGGIEVYFTLLNAGDADLPEGSGLQTYLQVVGDDGTVLVDRRVGMGLALAKGATHFGGDKLDVHPVHSTVFVYTNYKDDGTYDDLKSADYNPR